ncbi:hypothetical protein ACQ5SO_07495 [Rhodovulum sp. DZ06]|uniref:hypothetical protein n=1 Tax=Rhodovulum sp. DZ06 TaxID=3425126 RepID=UPI003D3570A9
MSITRRAAIAAPLAAVLLPRQVGAASAPSKLECLGAALAAQEEALEAACLHRAPEAETDLMHEALRVLEGEIANTPASAARDFASKIVALVRVDDFAHDPNLMALRADAERILGK